MVLVSNRLNSYISILQTQRSHGEGHEARRVGLEAMPLDPYLEGGHGAGQTRLPIGPAPMQHLLAMADQRQQREYRLDKQPVLPRAALTPLQGGGSALGGMEGGVASNKHALCALPTQPWPSLVRALRRGPRPPHAHPPLLQ